MPGADIRRPAFADFEGEASCLKQRLIVKKTLRSFATFTFNKRERIDKQ